MRVAPSVLLFLSLLVSSEGISWRASSPLAVPRAPFVVGKDGVSARSAASLSASSLGGMSSSSTRTFPKVQEETLDADNELVTDEGVRGGHAASSTMARNASQEDANIVSSTTAATTSDDTIPTTASLNGTATITETPVSSSPGTTSNVNPKKRARRNRKKKDKHNEGTASVYAKKLKNRNNLNIRRKVTHALFGLGFGAMNHFIPKSTFVPGMTILTSATLLMELLRYKKGFGWMNDALHFVLGSSLRKHEMEGKFTGSFYFFLGVTCTAALYPTTCATLGICQLALADPSASYFGRQTRHVYWSRIEGGLGGFGRNKGFLGFIGGALFCFPFNYRVLSLAKFGAEGIPGGRNSLALASLALGLAGAFADLAVPTPALTMPKKVLGVPVPPLHVDDNFVVPIVAGYACTQIFSYLGWPADLALGKFILI